VLASAVQVTGHEDQDRLRFSLTGEAGLNDGTAFPFVMLGLGLLGLHELGELGWRWLLLDGVWATLAGFGVGALLGTLIGRLVIYLRTHHREAVGLDEFLALGLVALAYGTALLIYAYGFLAVFAAGLALRRIERRYAAAQPPPEVWPAALQGGSEEVATDPRSAPAYMTEAVLGFNARAERIGELIVMLLVGAVLLPHLAEPGGWWLIALLLLLIRPLAVVLCLLGTPTSRSQRRLIAWFGIRGLGSVYYLAYATQHGLPIELAEQLMAVVLTTVAVSVVVHGMSVPSLMRRYQQQ
jgi:NhaP-type Na+/H+ or K+/H+ antiporter